MNQIRLWRRRGRYSVADAAQLFDCTPAVYESIEGGTARPNHPAVHRVENTLHSPYAVLKKNNE